MPKDLRVANDDAPAALLERFGFAELSALRKQLEEALALARAGVPVQMPPLLQDEAGDGGEDG